MVDHRQAFEELSWGTPGNATQIGEPPRGSAEPSPGFWLSAGLLRAIAEPSPDLRRRQGAAGVPQTAGPP